MRIHKAYVCNPVVCVWRMHTSSMNAHAESMRTHTRPNPNLENKEKTKKTERLK